MILSFSDSETISIFNGFYSKKLPHSIQNTARRKLRILDAAEDIGDLLIPPGNGLEKLKGDFKNYYSIRVNDQFRIVFQWEGQNAKDVKIIDYHK